MLDPDATPAKYAIQWGIGLVDPLISLRQRINADQSMTDLGRTNPTWVRIFFAGLLTNLGGTLPPGDRWRGTSARIGRMAVGPNPPPVNGAVGTDGAPWGTLNDALDVIEPVFGDPSSDPEFAALAEPISPIAAALVVFSLHGWRECREALEAAGKIAAGPAELQHLASSAVRWVSHRRRSYGGLADADPWVIESVLAWAWRAGDLVAGKSVDQGEIDKAIRAERIKTET